MATILVVVADVCPHEPDEMALAEDYDMLEELATAVSDPSAQRYRFATGSEKKCEQALCPWPLSTQPPQG